ncbi:MAG: alanine--glyoxylate aminotransferase family protein [Chloroflexi bacterium]|nr:alanine--glyoxylate aminotransferase family protein [Chloroflexota bacterium]
MSTHKRLVIPGPVEVREEILQAQTQWMIGHRSTAFADLYARMQTKLKHMFQTEGRVILLGSSGTGLWEAASRNCIRDDKPVLHLIGGAFSERWAEISKANGKQVDTVEVEWGQAHTPERVAEALSKKAYDAVCVVHNETSTGVTSPIKAIGEIVRQYDDTLFLVDTVSGFLGAELRVDDWGIDFALTRLAEGVRSAAGHGVRVGQPTCPRPRQAGAVPRLLLRPDRDRQERRQEQHAVNPARQFDVRRRQAVGRHHGGRAGDRWARHLTLREMTHQWADSRGFGVYADRAHASPTVTTVDNRTKQIDVDAMAKFMAGKNFSMDKGYGKIKGATFRIAHMGDMRGRYA